jgi:2-oxo-3-hexenedioate decarboxylase
MDDAALMGCIAWIAHGFEVVQSVFANWKFTAADSVAVNAMHGALLIGPRHNIGSRAAEWLRALPEFEVELFCDGTLMDRGRGSNVLEGPLSVVRHVTGLLESDPDNPSLAAGDLFATGTLTRALPVKAGETWTTKLKGIALEGISLRFC